MCYLGISNLIKNAATQYPEAKKGKFTGATIGNIFKNRIPEALKKILNYLIIN